MGNTGCSLTFKNSCVDHCCFYFTPKTGCLIIGYTHLVCILVLMVLSVVPFFTTLEFSPRATQGDANIGYFLLYSYATIGLIVCLIYLIFIIILLRGLHQNKPNCVITFINWLYFTSILHLVFHAWYWIHLEFPMIYFTFSGICWIINAYCLLVLHIYHKKMNEDGTNTVIYTAA
ncbi:unnamed protein product [Chrysodeixis includens]|uniref:Uncharacterized protein n=1 Tax=Chrysodeixis includens TaxID=689277 RepID=A0A9N8L0M1_CHRIL|nr:unnamed protein product [Chrysodeixis includens]